MCFPTPDAGYFVVESARAVAEALAPMALRNMTSFTASFNFDFQAPRAGQPQQPVRQFPCLHDHSEKEQFASGPIGRKEGAELSEFVRHLVRVRFYVQAANA